MFSSRVSGAMNLAVGFNSCHYPNLIELEEKKKFFLKSRKGQLVRLKAYTNRVVKVHFRQTFSGL